MEVEPSLFGGVFLTRVPPVISIIWCKYFNCFAKTPQSPHSAGQWLVVGWLSWEEVDDG